ncbi:MAG: toll/interleukin-1 receptor domain-containing protein, partial [Thermoanaerobaculia bacterium]|nr:toll/interleukin-1 receptor domain-containing protein [Thermoanaerobaculia bacterium]
MKDFFISYTSHDSSWAEWIAWQLEEEGYSVVIQAWDFDGNWVIGMDKAMKETNRTIAVLSRKYVEALYTQSEWTNSFLKDPTGEKDLLIPVRVDQFEPEGILAQIVYVDLVDKSKEDAKNLLLKRVRGERRKPLSVPIFPGNKNPDKPAAAHRVVTEEPVYPAEKEDTEKLRLARELIVRWRSMYADKIEALQEASILAREWSKGLPRQFDDDMAGVIELAAAVARDFRAIRIHELQFARTYGLDVHPTVFWGQALDDAIHQVEMHNPEARAAMKKLNDKRVKIGRAPIFLMPDEYGFEMIARVLESAMSLVVFNIDNLPRGYLKEDLKDIPYNIPHSQGLFIARIENDPKLHLMAAGTEIKLIGSFVARNLSLHVLCAQRNKEGSIDLIAWDAQNLYYWCLSGQRPTMQYDRNYILDAQFLSSEPKSPVLTVDILGVISVFTAGGTQTILHQFQNKSSINEAKIWIDPLDAGAWYVVSID